MQLGATSRFHILNVFKVVHIDDHDDSIIHCWYTANSK
jgi:hypothetical protein